MILMERLYIQTPQQLQDEAANPTSDSTPFWANTLSSIQVRTYV